MAGTVTFASHVKVWGNIVVIEHKHNDSTVYSRYAHLNEMNVKVGEVVEIDKQIGTIGQDEAKGPFHLHFDISHTAILKEKAWHWPTSELELKSHYVNPKTVIEDGVIERPQVVIPKSYIYSGPATSYCPSLHGPASDWMWSNADFKQWVNNVSTPFKYLSNGVNVDYAVKDSRFELVRIFWQVDRYKTANTVFEELKGDIRRFYDKGFRHFELLNEPNLPQEGFNVLWTNGNEFGNWLQQFIVLLKKEFSGIKLYYPGLSPGMPWTNQFSFTKPAWEILRSSCDGFCLHAYTGINDNPELAAQDIIKQIKETQVYLNLQKPLIVSECSVNRGDSIANKAKTYQLIDRYAKDIAGLKSVCYFVSWWIPPAEQSAHNENWFTTDLLNLYNKGL